MDEYKTGLNKAFFSLARGPSASTDRHFEKTSQYPKNIVKNSWTVQPAEISKVRYKPS